MRQLFKNSVVLVAFFAFALAARAQQNSVSIGTSSTNSSAVLWLNSSTGDQGFIIPVGDRTKVASPAKGMIIFDSNANEVYVYDNTGAWISIAGSAGSGIYTLSFNASTKTLSLISGSTGTPSVDLSTTALTGDLGGTLGSPVVTRINGTSVSSTKPNSVTPQFLVYDITSNAWTPFTLQGDLAASTLTTAANTFNYKVTGLNGKPLPAISAGVLTSDAGGNLSWGSGGGSVSNVTGSLPISVATGSTTPAISIAQATGLTDGYLSKGDWTTFNNKLGTASNATGDLAGSTYSNLAIASGVVTASKLASNINYTTTFTANQLASANGITAVGGISGGSLTITGASTSIKGNSYTWPSSLTAGVLTTDASGNLSWAAAGGSGTVTNVSVGGAPLSVTNPSTTPQISIASANTSTDGYLKSSDYNTFNNKVSLGGDLGGTSSSPTVSKIQNIGITWPNNSAGILSNNGSGTLSWGSLPSTFGSQTANFVFAAPNGVAGNPSFRALVSADLPQILNANVGAAAAIAGTKITPAFGAQNISTTGTLGAGASTLGSLTVPGTTTLNTVAYTWPNAQGAANAVLTNNGSGTLSWSGIPAPFTTNNVVPKGNGSGLTSSQIYDNGTNVGIGTVSPSAALHLVSSTQSLANLDGVSNPLIQYFENGTYKAFTQLFNNDFVLGASLGTNNLHLFNNGIFGLTVSPTGNVGINNTSPGSTNQLDVQTSYAGGGNAINAQNNSSGNGLYGYSSGGGNGVWGYSPSGNGVQGQSVSSTGVLGTTSGSTNAAVFGYNNNASGTLPRGVYGQADGTNAHGVEGYSGAGIGIYGSSSTGLAGYFSGNVQTNGGLEFVSANPSVQFPAGSTSPMIFMFKSGTTNPTKMVVAHSLAFPTYGLQYDDTNDIFNFVGAAAVKMSVNLISGAVNVPGTLTKGAGTFKIDHPTDPENKFLYHSFVESPDMMNIYNGNIITDSNGSAIVNLPDYFESLNKDFRYQLTVIGEFAQAIVAKKIQKNQFMIKTDKPNIEVSWQVTGIRKDPFAEKNRVVPEVLKSSEEKGKYLHPEAYGLPPEKGIGHKPNQYEKTKSSIKDF